MDVEENELADSLAKSATQLNPESKFDSFAVLGTKIKLIQRNSWIKRISDYIQLPRANLKSYARQYPAQAFSRIRLPRGTKRASTSAFFQLKISHGYFKSYLYRLGHVTSDICRCGHIKESPDHLLLYCTEYASQRLALREELRNIPISLQLILNTTLGIAATAKYLAKTEIATRKWHVTRRDEEERRERS